MIAAGDDGTIHEVTNALMLSKASYKIPALGIIPMGTASDFARSCELPLTINEALNI